MLEAVIFSKKSVLTMKKSNIIIVVLMVLLFISFGLTSFLLMKDHSNAPTNIYEQAIKYVVELKAVNSDDEVAYGTAIIINDDAELITNAHVVTYSILEEHYTFEHYYVRFATEETYWEVSLVRYDLETDLALLAFVEKPEKITHATIENKQQNTGSLVYSVGNAQNLGISISQGMISKSRVKIAYDNLEREAIQCDLVITAGNSGGALLNQSGKLIGITTFRTKDLQGNIVYGIAYCIPTDILISFLSN